MQLKVVLLCMLVVLIMMIATGVSKQYKEKCNIYKDVLLFLTNYELNIGFKKDKMVQMVESFKPMNSTKKIFDSYLKYLNNDTPIDINVFRLVEEDSVYLKEMFESLGHGDYEQEMKKVNSYKTYLEERLKISEENKNKFCPLILKLSFMFSLVVVILMI